MRVSRPWVATAAIAFILIFLFLVPVISYALPPGVYHCPANGCNFPRYGSITYWALGVGGIWTYTNSYSISLAPAPFATSSTVVSTSSVSYTVNGEPTHTTTTATDSRNNLQLRLFLNTSSSSAGGVMASVFVDEYNPLGTTNNVTAEDNETADGNWSLRIGDLDGAPCWSDDWPLGFAIASGHYTSANITTAKFLDLVNPGVTYSCPLYVGYGTPAGYAFEPMSDTATTYGCIGEPCLTGSVATGVEPPSWSPVTGYWNQGGAFTSFPRGTYTVVAADEWGEVAIAYFAVA